MTSSIWHSSPLLIEMCTWKISHISFNYKENSHTHNDDRKGCCHSVRDTKEAGTWRLDPSTNHSDFGWAESIWSPHCQERSESRIMGGNWNFFKTLASQDYWSKENTSTGEHLCSGHSLTACTDGFAHWFLLQNPYPVDVFLGKNKAWKSGIAHSI